MLVVIGHFISGGRNIWLKCLHKKICCLLANNITHCAILCFKIKGSKAMAFGRAEKARSPFQTDVLCGFSRDSTSAALL